ncbi:MAG: hypothetical protein AAGF11_14980 [Myxococcota bacterium]
MTWLDRILGTSVWLLAVGCSDDGLAPPANDQGPTTAAADDNGAGTVEDNEGADSAQDSGASDPTADSTADPTADPDGTTGGGDSGSDGTGNAPPAAICIDDRECVLINDCCECAAAHIDDMVECPLDCDTPTCDVLGIGDIGVVCEDQECRLESRNCADGLIVCDALPPRCPEGSLPEVTPQGDCWTGACIPLPACEGVPSCEYCERDEVCVELLTPLGTTYRCDPIPDACGDLPTCDCLPLETCADPFDTCTEGNGTIQCS